MGDIVRILYIHAIGDVVSREGSRTLTDSSRGDDGALGDELAPREAGERGALAENQ